jgi:hypothetical protein
MKYRPEVTLNLGLKFRNSRRDGEIFQEDVGRGWSWHQPERGGRGRDTCNMTVVKTN